MNKFLISPAQNAIATFVFAHGAGADMHHEFMTQVAQLLVAKNVNVVCFNFTYMIKRQLDGKRYPPDRMPKLLLSYQEVLNAIAKQEISIEIDPDLPLFIGGKSMGGRVAATLLHSIEFKDVTAKVLGLVCLGYPFHPQKQPEKLRLEPLHFKNSALIGKPTLIIQGERDSLGNKEEVLSYQLPKHCQSVFLEDGDHSFKPRVKSGFTQAQHIKSAIKQLVKFIHEHK